MVIIGLSNIINFQRKPLVDVYPSTLDEYLRFRSNEGNYSCNFEGVFLQRYFILSSIQKKEMYNPEGNLLDE
jgi:hypothetical protein